MFVEPYYVTYPKSIFIQLVPASPPDPDIIIEPVVVVVDDVVVVPESIFEEVFEILAGSLPESDFIPL